MARGTKVAPAMARQWLEEFDTGATLDQLRSRHRRTKRTISDNIDRARQQVAFERALQERLSSALGAHQEDLLELIQMLREAVHAPDLEFWPSRVDFGLEKLLSDRELTAEREVIIKAVSWEVEPEEPALLIAIRDKNGPQQVEVTLEESRSWANLRRHLGARDPLWRELAAWKDMLLHELEARAALNRAILADVEREFGVRVVRDGSPEETYLTRGFPHLVRTLATAKAIGSLLPDIVDRLGWSDNELNDQRNGRPLGRLNGDRDEITSKVGALVITISDWKQAHDAANRHIQLRDQTAKVRETLQDYQLLHFVRGSCPVCKKLGGI